MSERSWVVLVRVRFAGGEGKMATSPELMSFVDDVMELAENKAEVYLALVESAPAPEPLGDPE